MVPNIQYVSKSGRNRCGGIINANTINIKIKTTYMYTIYMYWLSHMCIQKCQNI